MQRAPHPPKGFIPSEGWASGSQGHPWSPTDKPAAGRKPIARLPWPPTAPPSASAAAHRLLRDRQSPAAPPALGTGESGPPEGVWGTGNNGVEATRGQPLWCPWTAAPSVPPPPPARPSPAGPARPEHAQCRPRLPAEQRGGRRETGMREGAGGDSGDKREGGARGRRVGREREGDVWVEKRA